MSGHWIEQTFAVTAMNLRNLPQRAAASVVTLVGIAGVVTVLVGILSMAAGFRSVLEFSGADDVAIVLRGGSTDEMSSSIAQTATRIISDAPGIARDNDGLIISPELYVIVDVPLRSTGTDANVPFRGVGPQAAKLRQDFRIIAGRNFTPGTFEIIVGSGAAQQFAGLEVGRRLRWGATEWAVVGIFEDRGSVAESEIWSDAAVLQSAYNRGPTFQSVRVKLTNASALPTFKAALTSDPRLNVRVLTERQYYQEQSGPMTALITGIGYTIAFLMGLGAIFGALNTMYSAVSARAREIATLRALGFSSGPVVASVLTESLILALVGGVAGGIIALLAFNGIRVSTLNFASFSQITFAFDVTPTLLMQGLIYALILGFFGGLLPSIRAARMPITLGLREG